MSTARAPVESANRATPSESSPFAIRNTDVLVVTKLHLSGKVGVELNAILARRLIEPLIGL
jgi:hypothetical protein